MLSLTHLSLERVTAPKNGSEFAVLTENIRVVRSVVKFYFNFGMYLHFLDLVFGSR